LSTDGRATLQVIAAAREPLAEHRIRSATGFDAARHATSLEEIRVLLSEGRTPDFDTTFTLHHEALRSAIEDVPGAAAGHLALLDTVAEWTLGDRGEFQNEYSLRYGLAHAAASGDRERLDSLVANLDFLEARCRLEPPRRLVEELERLSFAQVFAPSSGTPERSAADRAAEIRKLILENDIGLAMVRLVDFATDHAPAAVARAQFFANQLSAPSSGHGRDVRRDAALLKETLDFVDDIAAHAQPRTRSSGEPRSPIVAPIARALAEGRHWLEQDPASVRFLVHAAFRNANREPATTGRGPALTLRHPIARPSADDAEHRGAVRGCLQDDERLLSWSADGTVKVWRTRDWQFQATVVGHTREVTACEAIDGALLSASRDGTVRVLRGPQGLRSDVLVTHDDPIVGIRSKGYRGTLVSWDEGGLIRVSEGRSGREIQSVRAHEAGVTAVLPRDPGLDGPRERDGAG
jgi:hypothetical protein